MNLKSKDIVKIIKPGKCILAVLFVFAGCWVTSRLEVGIGRANMNLLFSSIIYLFLILAGMLVVTLLYERQISPQWEKDQFKLLGFAVGSYVISIVLTIVYMILEDVGIQPLILLLIYGAWFSISIVIPQTSRIQPYLVPLSVHFLMALSVIYGAMFNSLVVPGFIWLFSLAILATQSAQTIMTKMLLHDIKGNDNLKSYERFQISLDPKSWLIILWELLVITLLPPIWASIPNQRFYMIFILLVLLFFSIAMLCMFVAASPFSLKRQKSIIGLLRAVNIFEIFAFL